MEDYTHIEDSEIERQAKALNTDEWIVDDRGNKIHKTCVFGPNVTYGSNNYFGPYCVIGMPGEVASNDGKDGTVWIGDNNRFEGMLTIDASVNEEKTYIGNNCFIMKQVHIGHDAIIGAGVRIAPHATIGGEAVLIEDCNIGMNAVIHQRVIIPEGCMIGMGAVVTKKTRMQPWRKYAGVPAKDIGSNEAFMRNLELVGAEYSEGYNVEIKKDYKILFPQHLEHKCKHYNHEKNTVPRVVIAYNEGLHRKTVVCFDCVKEHEISSKP